MVLSNRLAKITDITEKAYLNCFGVKLWDPDKPYVPHVCSKTSRKFE